MINLNGYLVLRNYAFVLYISYLSTAHWMKLQLHAGKKPVETHYDHDRFFELLIHIWRDTWCRASEYPIKFEKLVYCDISEGERWHLKVSDRRIQITCQAKNHVTSEFRHFLRTKEKVWFWDESLRNYMRIFSRSRRLYAVSYTIYICVKFCARHVKQSTHWRSQFAIISRELKDDASWTIDQIELSSKLSIRFYAFCLAAFHRPSFAQAGQKLQKNSTLLHSPKVRLLSAGAELPQLFTSLGGHKTFLFLSFFPTLYPLFPFFQLFPLPSFIFFHPLPSFPFLSCLHSGSTSASVYTPSL